MNKRHFNQSLAGIFASIAVVLVLSAAAPSSDAAFIVTIQQDGLGNVVSNGSGTINTGAFFFQSYGNRFSYIGPSTAFLSLGPGYPATISYGGGTSVSGPSNFGPGGNTPTSSGSGTGVILVSGQIQVVTGYVSGSFFSNTDTWAGSTLTSLGLTPGSYTWTWGTGGTADSLTLNVVPEPASLSLLTLAGLTVLRRPRRVA